jgi:hypothetical protein
LAAVIAEREGITVEQLWEFLWEIRSRPKGRSDE